MSPFAMPYWCVICRTKWKRIVGSSAFALVSMQSKPCSVCSDPKRQSTVLRPVP